MEKRSSLQKDIEENIGWRIDEIEKRIRKHRRYFQNKAKGLPNFRNREVSIMGKFSCFFERRGSAVNGHMYDIPQEESVFPLVVERIKVGTSPWVYSSTGGDVNELDEIYKKLKKYWLKGLFTSSRERRKALNRFKDNVEDVVLRKPKKEYGAEELYTLARELSASLREIDGIERAAVVVTQETLYRIVVGLYGSGEVEVAESMPYITLWTSVRVKEKGKSGEFYFTKYRTTGKIEDADLEEGKEEAKKVRDYVRKGRSIREVFGRKRNAIVFGKEASGVLIHEILGHPAEKDTESERYSSLIPRRFYRKVIASPQVNVVDDPQMRMGGEPLPGTIKYDDEGIRARKVPIIRKGVFAGRLTDLHEGGVRSNGHGRGLEEIYPRMTNTVLLPGDYSMEELYEIAEEWAHQKRGKAVYVELSEGGYVGTETMTGEVDLSMARIYLIEKGELKPVIYPQMESPSIIVEFLNIGDIIAVGKQPYVFAGYCGKGKEEVPVASVAPAVVLKNVILHTKKI